MTSASIYKLKNELRAAYDDLDLALKLSAGPVTLIRARCRIAALEDELARRRTSRPASVTQKPMQIGVYRGGC